MFASRTAETSMREESMREICFICYWKLLVINNIIPPNQKCSKNIARKKYRICKLNVTRDSLHFQHFQQVQMNMLNPIKQGRLCINCIS